MLDLFCKIFLVSAGVFTFCGILYSITQGKVFKLFFHDVLGWHIQDPTKDHYLGINYCSVCKICGKEIMRDSQGNWY